MWRALSLAIGIFMCILGGECLVIDKAVLAHDPESTPAAAAPFMSMPAVQAKREIKPPEWAPWSLLSGGAVVILYSFTLPRRVAG